MTSPTRYQSKVVEIEAIKWDGSPEAADAIVKWSGGAVKYGGTISPCVPYLQIDTLEGSMAATSGDYVVKGLEGEFYPVKPRIFEKKYEVAP